MLSPDQFTEKTTETLSKAADLAKSYAHTQVNPIHVASALLMEPSSLFRSILQKSGVDATNCERKIQSVLVRQPSQSPAPTDVSFSGTFHKFINKADEIRKTQKDSHLSIDHLILALPDTPEFMNAVQECGLTKNAIAQAVQQVRGNRHIDSKTSDANYEALSKYAVDLVGKKPKYLTY